jgi:quinol monooxygenase YgiN
MVHVIATVELASGTREKFLAEFRSVIPAIDAETDIPIQFRVGADKVVVIEKWETVAALKAHGVAPHMQAYRARVKDFVRSMELRVLAPA